MRNEMMGHYQTAKPKTIKPGYMLAMRRDDEGNAAADVTDDLEPKWLPLSFARF